VLTTADSGVARFDYNPSTLAPLGLLIEEARTNSWVQSADFSSASWTKVRSSITADAAVSPAGTVTADKLIANTDNNTHFIRQDIAVTSGTSYTQTIFAKAAEYSQIQMNFDTDNSAFAIGTAVFTLTGNGSVSTSGTLSSSSITFVGNGWYRCQISAPATATTTGIFRIYAANGGVASFAGNGTSGILIWGAQLEAGAFATSYIPTTTTALTRSADVASMTGTNFSSWYSASEGTIYGQSVLARQPAATANILAISDGTADNFIDLRYRTTGTVGAQVFTLAAVQVNNTTGPTATANLLIKDCFAFAANNAAESINGLTPIIDSSISVPTVNRMFIGANPNGNASFLNGYIQRITYYPARLVNAQLQALTL
jgi:hypothetical protein